MTTSIQPREEVFPGYLLTERIGSGGYAEVWRARAPGGIDKAVKIVFGCYDEQLAVQEMKALERIKDVRHPFVLSLERFEIVDGRLAILTELADLSLEQRAQQCRTQGLPGIPREELLRYMADTAEALDYLAERHKLQHLDIKPANLLISGEHVKVADFGLVKELASRTNNSMVAGMTPTYSSPEMFDDAPTAQSDQYSLAIVYQEMLTGVLPFPGRTTAQLANQHLRLQPQLAALSEIDRKTVARALAKNPPERFSSCRAFVKALIEPADAPAMAPKATHKTQGRAGIQDGDSSKPSSTVPRTANDVSPSHPAAGGANTNHPTQAQQQGTIETKSEIPAVGARPKEEIFDVAVPGLGSTVDTHGPTLYIAAGGIGIRILCRLRELLARRASASQPAPAVEMIALDTDRAELRDACSKKWSHPLPSADALCLSLKLPHEYREQGRTNLEWISHRWLYNIPRSLETRGYRPLGRLALVDHVDRVLPLVDRKLAQLAATRIGAENQPAPPEVRVVLLVGMGGGTGGGMAIDLANAARSRIEAAGHRGQVQGVFVCNCLGNTSATPMSVANTYALLTELRFVAGFGNQPTRAEATGLPHLESPNRPFDLVYFERALHDTKQSIEDGLSAIARDLSWASIDGVRQMLQCCRQTATPRELAGKDPLLLRTFGSAPLAGTKQNRINRLGRCLVQVIEQIWLDDVSPGDWRRLDRAGIDESMLQSQIAQLDSPENSNMAPATPRIHADEWRDRFGAHSSTRFAFETVSRICRQSGLRGAYRKSLLSVTDPAKLVELAMQAILSIGNRAAASPTCGESLSDEDAAIVKSLAPRSSQALTKIVDEIEQSSADFPFEAGQTDRLLLSECSAAVEECLGQQAIDPAGEPNSAAPPDTPEVSAQADVDLLQCGYDRRTLIVVPAGSQTSEAIAELTTARPTAAVVPADVDESFVFCEGSGVNPSSLARGFERVYPGIAEAAGRLFTRNDIDWSAATL
jgi:serine/threonine protein kinase